MIMKDDTLEKLAELEHVQWCEWADVLSDDLSSLLKVIEKSDVELSDEEQQVVVRVKDRLDKWDKLMIPFSDLPEDEKEKDRVYARKVMTIISD